MRHRVQLFALGLAALTALAGADAPAPARPLDIYFIDVMGGAATLVVTPAGESLLIDSGWPGFGDRDPIRIEHVLRRVAGLERIDYLATTHWHVDHYGGVGGLARRVPIGTFWDRGMPDPKDPEAERIIFPDGPFNDALGNAYREASQGKRRVLDVGNAISLRGGVSIVVLAAGQKTIVSQTAEDNPLCATAPEDQTPDLSDNARSLAFRIRMGRFDFLDCGDLTWNVERNLVCPRDTVGAIDLFQVTHHGSKLSNHPTLLRTIAPTVTVMNNGPRKGGDAEVIQLLKSIPSIQANYQLHRNIRLAPEQNTDPALIANKDPEGGQFIHVSVPPDGSQFTVRIGSDGPARTFATR